MLWHHCVVVGHNDNGQYGQYLFWLRQTSVIYIKKLFSSSLFLEILFVLIFRSYQNIEVIKSSCFNIYVLFHFYECSNCN